MVNTITPRVAAELVSHEGLVSEAYLDSVDVWTWSVGITNASGHEVMPRYKDAPASLEICLAAFESVLRDTYKPAVDEEFDGHRLTEAQFGAALSFHYNTGGIRRATWAEDFKRGDLEAARENFMNWCKPELIIPRRLKERDLFFDGVWSNDGTALQFPVAKPSYKPDIAAGVVVDIMTPMETLFG